MPARNSSIPHRSLTATTFVPRRVLYELRAGRDYFKAKERCVFCDIISQELQQNQRVIEVRGDFIALCPYAPARALRNLDHPAQLTKRLSSASVWPGQAVWWIWARSCAVLCKESAL